MKTTLLLTSFKKISQKGIIRTCGSHVPSQNQFTRTCGSHVPTIVLIILISFNFYLLSSQVPQGFNYQAIARDGSGNLITNATINVKLSILKDTTGFYATGGGIYVWEEEQTGVKTNAFGLFNVVFGKTPATKVQGTAASFSEIDWTKKPLFIGTKIGNPSPYKYLGTAALQSVPYAMVTQSVSGLKSLSVRGETALMDSALFEVRNNFGKTVFAVYNEGVRISVGDGNAKGTKGGFAIGGFDGNLKTGIQDYLRVYRDSTRVFVKDLAKGTTKGGFAIGGFDGAKGSTGSFLNLTKENYFIGHESGSKIPLTGGGLYNSIIGYQAAKNLSTGSYNTAIGHFAGYSIIDGYNNILLGESAGYSLTSGNHNTLIGTNAGYNHTDEQYNVMIGTAAGFNLISTSPGENWYNTFMGINAGYKIKSGTNNVFLGTNAGAMLENGEGNTIVGIDAGRSGPWDWNVWHPGNVTSYNTLIGNGAGYSLDVGSGNVFIGYNAGHNEVGTIGTPSDNKLYIANSSNDPPLIYGDFSSGSIGIGTKTLTKKLNVDGNVGVTGNVAAGSFTGDITGNVTGNVSGSAGSVGGVSMGKIYLTATGNIIQTFGTSYTLYWIKATGEVYIYNYSTTEKCEYWYRTAAGATGSGSLAAGGSASTFISGIGFTDGVGVEVHFGSAHGQQGWCSVWLQYANGSLVGHYMKY